jgi:hypothetical protein
MSHPLVTQLRFARSEFVRCLEGISDADARHRFEPMNCISWIIGHLAEQEHRYWLLLGQDRVLYPDLYKRVGFGKPATTPPLDEMWATWRAIAEAADPYLDTLTPDTLQTHFMWKDTPLEESIGTMLHRNIYHYWFHTGEAHAIRQQIGHTDLPQFVGDMSAATYHPEED